MKTIPLTAAAIADIGQTHYGLHLDLEQAEEARQQALAAAVAKRDRKAKKRAGEAPDGR